MFLNEPYLFARKCSQCRQKGCNKGKADCPVNIANNFIPRKRRSVTCIGCDSQNGCEQSNWKTCPIRAEICKHNKIVRINPTLGSLNNNDFNYNMLDHIQDKDVKEMRTDYWYNYVKKIYVEAYKEHSERINAQQLYDEAHANDPVVTRLTQEQLAERGINNPDFHKPFGKDNNLIRQGEVEFGDGFKMVGNGEWFLAPEGYCWGHFTKKCYYSVEAYAPVPINK